MSEIRRRDEEAARIEAAMPEETLNAWLQQGFDVAKTAYMEVLKMQADFQPVVEGEVPRSPPGDSVTAAQDDVDVPVAVENLSSVLHGQATKGLTIHTDWFSYNRAMTKGNPVFNKWQPAIRLSDPDCHIDDDERAKLVEAVSYTHLTLPTKRIV